MATQYRIYANDAAGGPVDYGTVVATVAVLHYDAGPLAYGSDTTFAVRAFDTVSGLEDRNVDARLRLQVSAAGADLTGLPNAPYFLRAVPKAGGGAVVTWGYNPRNQGGAPAGFHVYQGTPTVSYASPVATVPYAATNPSFSATLTSLADGSTYQFAVRAYNASGTEANAAVVAMTASSTGPRPASNLTATVTS